MGLSPRQRRILADMGIPVWRRREVPAAGPETEATGNDPASSSPGAPRAVSRETPPTAGKEAEPVPLAQESWEALESRVRGCTVCTQLAAARTQTVFGVGDPAARWFFVGEAPGAEEDRRGEPFVGRAGQLLDNMLAALGIDRTREVFIANVLKCRPPGNRDPRPEEAVACRGFLDRQIALIQPQVIVALGRIAAQSLLDSDEPLGRLRSRQHRYQEVPLIVTYHPAYLLRRPMDKAKSWQDLLQARACLRSHAEP